jgi:hypothetical protein
MYYNNIAMELNFITLGYLFFRLAPFILVCFFSLNSLFNQDFKGLVYLIGLLITCFLNSMLGKSIPAFGLDYDKMNDVCEFNIGGGPLEYKLPISQCIFGYTGAYLIYLIVSKNYVGLNIPTIVFFPVIAIIDGYWNFHNNCYSIFHIVIALGIGIVCGCGWAILINALGLANLQYFNKISGSEECSRPAKNTFKCNVYKNGKLLSATNMG